MTILGKSMQVKFGNPVKSGSLDVPDVRYDEMNDFVIYFKNKLKGISFDGYLNGDFNESMQSMLKRVWLLIDPDINRGIILNKASGITDWSFQVSGYPDVIKVLTELRLIGETGSIQGLGGITTDLKESVYGNLDRIFGRTNVLNSALCLFKQNRDSLSMEVLKSYLDRVGVNEDYFNGLTYGGPSLFGIRRRKSDKEDIAVIKNIINMNFGFCFNELIESRRFHSYADSKTEGSKKVISGFSEGLVNAYSRYLSSGDWWLVDKGIDVNANGFSFKKEVLKAVGCFIMETSNFVKVMDSYCDTSMAKAKLVKSLFGDLGWKAVSVRMAEHRREGS